MKPEGLQGLLPPDYFNTVNSVVYLKTSVLIIDNAHSYSEVVSESITIYAGDVKLEVRLTIAIGEIIGKLRNAAYPFVSFQLGGVTFGGYQY